LGKEDGKGRREERKMKGVWKRRRDERMRGKGVGERKGN